MVTRFLNLNNDTQASVFDKEDFIDLIEERLGYEARGYLEELLEEVEEDKKEEVYKKLTEEIEELEEENRNLNNELEKVRNELEENKQDIPLDDILSMQLCKVILEVKKLTKISKSQSIAEQQGLIIEMLNRIAKIDM